MPSITFDEFDIGLDLRKSASVSDANRLRQLKNCYVTSGKVIKKRPGLTKLYTMTGAETGTVGLVGGLGKLNVFKETTPGAVAHSLITAHRVNLPNTSPLATKILGGDVYAGKLYVVVQYDTGGIRHHWVDGTVYSSIESTNYPEEESFAVFKDRVFATDGGDVKFTAIGDPKDWNGLEAGFINVSSHARGSSDAAAISTYDGRLAVYFPDSVQFWNIDPDKALFEFAKSVEGVGTVFPRTTREFAGDTIFLSGAGFRSVTTLDNSNQNLAETDVGSAIDELVRPLAAGLTSPFAEFYTAGGQYWCFTGLATGDPVWVYTFSRTQKISAWSQYEFPFPISDVANAAGNMYVRSGEHVYMVDNTAFGDGVSDIEMVVEMAFLDFKQPGSLKVIRSMDIVVRGEITIKFAVDPNNPTIFTDPITVSGDSRPYQTIPLEITAVSISPYITNTGDKDVQIDAITFHYDELGPV